MKRTAAALSLLILVPSALRAGDLDGTQWKLRPQGAKAALFWQRDTLSFDRSLFSSTDKVEEGFRPGPYVTMEDGDAVTWSAAQTSDNGEQIQWQGVRTGDEMTGTYTIMGTDGKVRTVRWKATLESDQRPQQESGGPAAPVEKKPRRSAKPPAVLNG